MTTSLLSQRKLRTGGPWWFIQLWAQLYFQHQIPNFQSLAKNSFPDENGKPIRCTSYGQALFSLPGSKLNSTDAAKTGQITRNPKLEPEKPEPEKPEHNFGL